MNWIILLIAGLCEVVWLIALKYSDNFTRLVPVLITVSFLALSMFLLSISLKSIPLGTAYAVWTGIGVVGGAVCGILFFNESKDLVRISFIFMIIVGIIGLKLSVK
ncbi:MAG: quaternary ammonium compound efflux SMR transporter SugE [Cytophagaceae bacterium]